VTTVDVDPDWIVLGLVSQMIAGAFMLTSIGGGRPRLRAQFVLGVSPESLSGLRASITAKGRSLFSAIYFLAGTFFMLAGVLLPGEASPTKQFWAAGALLLSGCLFFFLLDGYVRRIMRGHLRKELLIQNFAFEDHIGLTREIGELFGVEAKQGETLETYVQAVRSALGLPKPVRTGGGFGVRR